MDDPAREIPDLVNVLLKGIDHFAPAAAPIGNIRNQLLNGSHFDQINICSLPVLGDPSVFFEDVPQKFTSAREI